MRVLLLTLSLVLAVASFTQEPALSTPGVRPGDPVTELRRWSRLGPQSETKQIVKAEQVLRQLDLDWVRFENRRVRIQTAWLDFLGRCLRIADEVAADPQYRTFDSRNGDRGEVVFWRWPVERHFLSVELADEDEAVVAAVAAYVAQAIEHEDWRIASRSVSVARCLPHAAVFPGLIEGLAVWIERGADEDRRVRRVQGEILDELRRRSGRSLGLHPDRWGAFWEGHQRGEVSFAGEGVGAERITQAGFFGLRPETDRVVFVLDRSGSMDSSFGDDTGRTRLEVAAEQLASCLTQLGPRTRFGVVAFSDATQVLYPRLRGASEARIEKAKSWVLRGGDRAGTQLRAGVSYVGNKAELRDLYHSPAPEGDTFWYTLDKAFAAQWHLRLRDRLDRYQPDLFYSDGSLPFGIIGRDLLAHYYNSNMARHGGELEAVYAYKSHHEHCENSQYVEGAGTLDVERGGVSDIQARPWQTDTTIGDWFHNPTWRCRRTDGSLGEYRDAGWVIRILIDIVSKNGNLLLNVVQRSDGSIAAEAQTLLEEVGHWLEVHGEAIYATRPWRICGEGPVLEQPAGPKREDFPFSARDIRFTTRDGLLYALALGWPGDGRLRIRSLGRSVGEIRHVTLLGSEAPLTWRHSADALEVDLPAAPVSEFACALRIER